MAYWARYTGGCSVSHPDLEEGAIIAAHEAIHTKTLVEKGDLREGDRAPYVCLDPDCGQPVFRKAGLDHHIQSAAFSHYSDTDCTGGGDETLRHYLMKEGIADLLNLQSDVHAVTEQPLSDGSGVQPDVTVTMPGGELYHIEVVVTHAPEEEVIERLGRKMFVVHANACRIEDIQQTMLAPALAVHAFLEHYASLQQAEEGTVDLDLFKIRHKEGVRRKENYNSEYPRYLDRLRKFHFSTKRERPVERKKIPIYGTVQKEDSNRDEKVRKHVRDDEVWETKEYLEPNAWGRSIGKRDSSETGTGL